MNAYPILTGEKIQRKDTNVFDVIIFARWSSKIQK